MKDCLSMRDISIKFSARTTMENATQDDADKFSPEPGADPGEGKENNTACPLFEERVSAGFPSPAQGYVERGLDLHQLCVKRPAATFFVRAGGDSMIGAGIHEGDILVVDRSLKPAEGDVVISSLWGELTVKRLLLSPRPALVSENPKYKPIEIPEGADWELFGVVTTVVHSLRGKL